MDDDASQDRNPFRCFDRRFLLGSLAVAIAIVVLERFARPYGLGSAPRLAIGGAQALLLAGLALACVRSIRRLDEMMLKLHLEAIAISFAVIGALIAGWGMLEEAGAPRIAWGLWAWPLMVVLWGGAVAIRSRQYR